MHSTKRFNKTYFCSSGIASQEKRADWILRIFTFNNKNPPYLPISSTLQFFEGQSDEGVTQLVIKPFGVFQLSRIVSLR